MHKTEAWASTSSSLLECAARFYMVAVSSEFYTEGGWGVYLLGILICAGKKIVCFWVILEKGLVCKRSADVNIVLKISLLVCVRWGQALAATLFANSTTDVFVYLVMSSQLAFQLQGQCAPLCVCILYICVDVCVGCKHMYVIYAFVCCICMVCAYVSL